MIPGGAFGRISDALNDPVTQEQAHKAIERELYKRELAETRWALYHLNFPQNARGFGPWANEQISYSEARKGSILGLGFVDNPFDQTEAERRALLARDQNRIRAQVRDAFNSGQTFDQIRDALNGNDAALIPRDLATHYGVAGQVSQAAAFAANPPSLLSIVTGGLFK